MVQGFKWLFNTLQLMIAHFEAEDFSAADKNRPA